MYEETYHIPLLMRLPGVPGRRVSDFASLADLYPTILDLLGAATPPGTDAISLSPILAGGKGLRDSVTGQFFGFDTRGLYYQQMIRMGKFKYIFNPSDLDELYDLECDPPELNNLAEDPAQQDTLKRLRQALVAEMKRTKDQFLQWAPDLMWLPISS